MRFHGPALISLALLATPAGAQVTLKTDPAPGSLMAGMQVFVDDGSCGPGRIKQVTAANPKAGIRNRTSECVSADVAANADPIKEYRMGGKFVAFDPVVDLYNQTGKLFRISGHCQSACTLFLGIKNVCVEPDAEVNFHAGSTVGDSGDKEISEDATEHMLDAYNDALRDYLVKNHVMETDDFSTISGADLIQKFHYPPCPPA